MSRVTFWRLTWLICSIGWGLKLLLAQGGAPFVKHLTVEEGLSNNWVKTILKDQTGFMWFGTFNGLNRYDGNEAEIFRRDGPTGLTDNYIQALAEDQDGFLWVGTFSGGLHRFDPATETFTVYRHDPRDESSLGSNHINALLVDQAGTLWVGTENGLDRYLPESDGFAHQRHLADEPNSLTGGAISTVFQDRAGTLWIGTRNGLTRFSPERGTYEQFLAQENNPHALAHPHVSALYEDKYGGLWVGTWGGGLHLFVPEEGHFLRFQAAPDNPTALSNNSILTLAGDGENLVYIATEGGGINILDVETRRFQRLVPDPTDDRTIGSNSIHALYYDSDNGLLWSGSYHSGLDYFSKWDKPFFLLRAQNGGLNDNHITSIAEDPQGHLWIGTDGGGLNVWNPENDSFRYYTSQSHGIANNAILTLHCDTTGRVWVGTYQGGLDYIAPDGRTRHFRHDPSDPHSLSGRSVSCIYEDRRGNLWVGTMTGGLNRYRPENRDFIRYQHDPDDPYSPMDNYICGIWEDRRGRLLVLMGKGLAVFDYRTERFSTFPLPDGNNLGFPQVLWEDTQGHLWVGTKANGLFRIDRTGVQVDHYTEADGLPSQGITGILEDDAGNLWISTERGLCQFEKAVTTPERVRFLNYSVKDGLQGSEFKRGAYARLRDGRMAFGGQNGLNLFDPIQIRSNPFEPPVVITRLRLFNREIDFRENDLLAAPISQLSELTLDYTHSVFTLEFAALNFILPENNQYAYRLDNFEDSWNYVGTQNSATYTNLDPGTYTFRVKASNNDGIWNEEGQALRLTISPPWWDHPFFKAAMGLLLLGLLIGFYKYRTVQLQRSKRRLEHKVAIRTEDLREATALSEQRQQAIMRQNEALIQQNTELEHQAQEIQRMAEQIKELNQTQVDFFTNISHELRTPLNLILWPLEELLASLPASSEELNSRHQQMYQQATKLIRLINQLLDFRKVKPGALAPNLVQRSVNPLVREIFDGFQTWAQQRGIAYTLKPLPEDLECYLDPDKLDKILSNLLSNAFKAVEDGGTISVSLELEEDQASPDGQMLAFRVTDNGRGIPAAQQERIFERFYEGEATEFEGSGIGLAFVKELVALQGGKISLQSKVKEGTSIGVTLPVYRERPTLPVFGESGEESAATTSFPPALEQDSPINEGEGHLPTLLLVEDSAEILSFMRHKLQEHYHLVVAENGQQGLEIAHEAMPDLVISDVMMPVMDGYELCRSLKSDPGTSHIPVLLVTARTGEEAQLKGLASGADDFITKPYSFPVLQLKIRNILATRQKLRNQYLRNVVSLPESLEAHSVEEQFLQQAAEIVRKNLQNPDFGVEDFAGHFNLNRRSALRKMKAITGLSINEFIRSTRLKEAYRLLQTGESNVSEAAYSVGFTDPKYFSLCFKKQFGESPSEVRPVV